MQPSKKLFAEFTGRSWCVSEKDFEIRSEQEAVQHALQISAILFNTYEVTTVTLGGKELKGEPDNFSNRRYVGINKIYTRDEVISFLQQEQPYPGWDAKMFHETMESVVDVFKEKSVDEVYITGLERRGEFINIEAGQKVFDKKGQQLWPKAQTPAPRNVSHPKP